jgi:ferrous iron transport protein B
MCYTIVYDIRHFGTPTASVKSGEGNMKRYTKNEILEILESTDKERILSYRTDRERVLANPLLKDRLADILSEAEKIEVISVEEAERIVREQSTDNRLQSTDSTLSRFADSPYKQGESCGQFAILEEEIRQVALDRRKEIQVALVGNPNAGKTSLFNVISGAHEKVGNYSGVTVDAKETEFEYKGYHIKLVDLPGTYSLSASSPEERYVRNQIVKERPDVIVNVVDAGNLERNLFLTTQLIDMNVRMVIALNMYDELEAKGDRFDYESLSAMIGVPMIPTVSNDAA